MASFLVRAFDIAPSSTTPFGDVNGGPHAADIAAIAAEGITNGCQPGSYCPDRKVTRDEMATFLARALGLDTSNPDSRFTDDNANTHEPSIEAIASAGITNGCGGSNFCPSADVTRDQMASFIGRALGLSPVAVVQSGSTITVNPGDNLQQLTLDHPPGTTFILTPGQHYLSSVRPQDDQKFIGQDGAIANGEGRARQAFAGAGDRVLIDNIVFEDYESGTAQAVILTSGVDWTVQNSEFRYNSNLAITFDSGWKVLNNHIHHNGQLGIKGYGVGALVEGNEIAYNNYLQEWSFGWEAGASKFIRTENLTVRNNYVHNNEGPGLWTDGYNVGTLYEGNVVEDNAGPGIFHEISYQAVIRNNTVSGNAKDFYLGGILVANSRDVEVYGNVLTDNDGGIVGFEDDRRLDGEIQIVDNLWVHDNQISFNQGVSGLWSEVGDGLYQRNNRYDRNVYTTTVEKPFRWNYNYVAWTDWQAAGQDPAGSFSG
jgi:parallel beta-helix repeat protein